MTDTAGGLLAIVLMLTPIVLLNVIIWLDTMIPIWREREQWRQEDLERDRQRKAACEAIKRRHRRYLFPIDLERPQ